MADDGLDDFFEGKKKGLKELAREGRRVARKAKNSGMGQLSEKELNRLHGMAGKAAGSAAASAGMGQLTEKEMRVLEKAVSKLRSDSYPPNKKGSGAPAPKRGKRRK